MRVYGADKVWKQMNREGLSIARCTVERLMKRLGFQGVRRGKVVRTTISDMKALCPLDRVNRQFKANRPNQLWVSVAICSQNRRSISHRSDGALGERIAPRPVNFCIHPAGRPINTSMIKVLRRPVESTQYVSIRCSERLAEAGIEPSVGSKGDSYDNILAETINGCTRPR